MEAAFCNEAVKVGMEDHSLAPRMKSSNNAGLCADMLRVKKELVEGGSHTGEEEGGHVPYVVKPDLVEIMGYGKDHVVMAAGEEPFFLSFEPFGNPSPLALRAEAMAAGVVPVSLIVAFRTRFRMAAQFGGSA